MNNSSVFKRDFFLLAALLLMTKVAVNLKHDEPVFQSLSSGPSMRSVQSSLDNAESNTEPIPIAYIDPHMPAGLELAHNEPSELPPFEFHIIDENLLKQIDCALNHIKESLKIAPPASYQTMQLNSLKHRLVRMRKSYQHTSPGVALLGPFASTGLIIKEQKMQQDLLAITNRIGSILHELAHHDDEYQTINSVMAALEANHCVLAKIRSV